KGGQKHRADNRNQRCSRARVAKCRERGEGKYTEVGQRAKQGDRNAAHLRIRTAQYTETIWRSSAAECLAGQRLHSQISRVRKAGQRNDRGNDIKDRAESRYSHFFSEVELFAFTASSTSLRTPSGFRSFGIHFAFIDKQPW